MPYDVHGTTAAEANLDAENNGPNKPYSGMTNPGSVSVRSSVQCQGSVCTAWVNAITFSGITISLPHWVEFSKASAQEQSAWTASLDSLIKHENGHVLDAANAQLRLQAQLKVGGIGPSEGKALQNINTKIHALETRYKVLFQERNAAYDQRTCHGTCQ